MPPHEPQTTEAQASDDSSQSEDSARPRHPRRPPAAQSVSLLHPGRQLSRQQSVIDPNDLSSQNSQAPQSDRANPPSSPSSQIPKTLQYSSGESSDAGKWFENSNNNIGQNNQSYVDNDPPFFLRNSSSSSTPPDPIPDGPRPYARYPQTAPIPYRPGLMAPGNDSSSVEDYRSVIDDLTVVNKKLKKKLRKYEKLYDAHLQGEKLFEVRVHGLPPSKKKELEETLQKFAMSIGQNSNESPSNSEERVGARLDPTASSSLTSRVAESGYASMSMSASGHNSSAQSTGREGHNRSNRSGKSSGHRQRSDIQMYLQEIPAGLLPKHTTAMSEKSKKKLVVRRLEQIFAGKGAVGAHHQPLQQEEIAQSAAAADKKSIEDSGRTMGSEGMREARIMSASDKSAIVATNMEPGTHEAVQQLKQQDQDVGSSNSPNQRPTRPLDLDPHRAQVPIENMSYFRHLGFSPPDPATTNTVEEGHGWIYLNLLVNMAQLHTINVTTDFVKDALKEYSDNLELSLDGRKVRWKGGHDITRNSSDTSSDPNSGISPDEQSMAMYANRRSKKHRSESDDSGANKRVRQAVRSEKDHRLSYTPLFFHKESSEGGESSALGPSSLSSPLPAQDSGFTSSGDRTNYSRRRGDDGPIIFYNKANFCTDLSGDVQQKSSTIDPTKYHRTHNLPIGDQAERFVARSCAGSDNIRGGLSAAAADGDRMEISDQSSSSTSLDIDFSAASFQSKGKSEQSPRDYDFEVSGIGGVEPRDNFAIHVISRHSRVPDNGSKRRQSSAYPPKLRTILEGAHSSGSSRPSKFSQESSTVSEQIISTTHKLLPASTLPPASFLPFTSFSDDSDSDLDSVASRESVEPSVLSQQHPIARQLLNYPFESNSDEGESSSADGSVDKMDEDDEGEADSEDEGDEEESVDFLATARELDPTTIAAREREYDANMAERLAEEIPAGSSAATAGGGSGFGSPNSQADDDEKPEDGTSRKLSTSSHGSNSRRASLKRARTSESLVVHGKAPKLE